MRFTKMHGLGNDFIIIENMENKIDPVYLAKQAPGLCNRNFGIGADGLVILASSSKAPFRMSIFNPDGSEPEMCGNAIRCLAKYVWDRRLINETTFSFDTAAGIKEVNLLIGGQGGDAVRVDMGEPVLDREKIPVEGSSRQAINESISIGEKELIFTAVSMGNPHCVIFVPDLEAAPWKSWGAVLEKEPLFPKGTNVEFVEIMNSGEIKVKVWERGVGPTLACGTGACAAVVAGVLTGQLLNAVVVHLPGGDLLINWEKSKKVYMEGPAVEVFTGEV
ncbi:MAG: diaminopimelate epimerase [Bacillota bacterium]|nr:diaminopimelate epimerase [Bacillota bacterium]